MENQDEDVIIACTLTDEEMRTRRALARRTILPKIIKYERLSDGLTLAFSNSPETRSCVEDFILLEKGCCGFLTFDLTSESTPPSGALVLTITGPSDAASVLDTFIQTVEAGANAQDAA